MCIYKYMYTNYIYTYIHTYTYIFLFEVRYSRGAIREVKKMRKAGSAETWGRGQ